MACIYLFFFILRLPFEVRFLLCKNRKVSATLFWSIHYSNKPLINKTFHRLHDPNTVGSIS